MADVPSGNLIFRDYQGRSVRLLEKQLLHIHERHSEMIGMEWAIGQTIETPEAELPSIKDPDGAKIQIA